MRFFVPAVFLAACSVLTAAAPAASIGNTSCDDAITLRLGHNGINVGDSRTLYHDVTKALEELCAEDYCLSKAATFPVSIIESTTRGPYYRERIDKTISVSVLTADWGRRADVRELMSSTIAAAFERGTYDPKNCHMNRVKGDKVEHFRDCMTLDYAEVVLSNGYSMKVMFGGPHSSVKGLNYDCKREVDDMYPFLKTDLLWKAKAVYVYCLSK
ncbi:hypothetical protein J4E91_005190 [Alternaria rosae]|nr:hypothetical protein J4E91_005190 [Alternaria rosae]